MFERVRRGGAIATALALAIAGFGLAGTALAEGESTGGSTETVETYELADAKLTKVVVAPEDTDISGDTYTFSFEGQGTVRDGNAAAEEDPDLIYSEDGIAQDQDTIKVGDVIPAIADVMLTGTGALSTTNSLTNGQSFQTVIQKPLSQILDDVEFPHAGVYTYRVSESATTTALTDGYYINPSGAKYILRVRVVNDKNAQNDSKTSVEAVTLERTHDDDGRATDKGKIDPTYPKATDGKITEVDKNTMPTPGELAGETSDRGRDVNGFTFANEYVKGGDFKVMKYVDGDYADKTKLFRVKLEVHSEATTAPDAQGACLTYKIMGDGVDQTDNVDPTYGRRTLNGVTGIAQSSDPIAVFDSETGVATIEADLKEGSYILITGVFGPYAEDYTGPNGEKRMILSTSGLLAGNEYTVTEGEPGLYEPTGYVYVGEDATADPRTDATGMTATQKKADGTLVLTGSATGSATTVFVVNELLDNKVSPTGIFIDNLPYILMVGVPLVVFAGMFVARRRGSAAA